MLLKKSNMISQFQTFKDLHYQHDPLILGNAWSAQSAKILEQSGYKAIGTSSAAIAHSLGYEDGEVIPFDIYLYLIKCIKRSVTIPVSVDMEAGFGATLTQVVNNISKLMDLGIAGINIEDSTVKDGIRKLENASMFADKLKFITDYIGSSQTDMFVNVRTDTFLLDISDALNETIRRIKLYENLNIDGVFVPGITSDQDIGEVIKSTKLPLNVMCMPALANFDSLKALGVKRISMGNFTNDYIYRELADLSQKIIYEKSFECLF